MMRSALFLPGAAVGIVGLALVSASSPAAGEAGSQTKAVQTNQKVVNAKQCFKNLLVFCQA